MEDELLWAHKPFCLVCQKRQNYPFIIYTICKDGGDENPIFIQTNEETHILDPLAPDDHPLSTNLAFEPPVTETLDEKPLLLYQFMQSNKTLARDLQNLNDGRKVRSQLWSLSMVLWNGGGRLRVRVTSYHKVPWRHMPTVKIEKWEHDKLNCTGIGLVVETLEIGSKAWKVEIRAHSPNPTCFLFLMVYDFMEYLIQVSFCLLSYSLGPWLLWKREKKILLRYYLSHFVPHVWH